MLEPVAGLTVLDDQPPVIGGFPERLGQLIRYHTLLNHVYPPFLVFSRAKLNLKSFTWSKIFIFMENVKGMTGRETVWVRVVDIAV
jgi:hypothetical protein